MQVVLQEDAKEGLVVVRYPAGTAVQRRRATERSPDRGMQAARDKAEKVRAPVRMPSFCRSGLKWLNRLTRIAFLISMP